MDRNINGGTYYFDDSSILKYLRKVLAEINPIYVDCGLRSAFLLKRYIEKYDIFDDEKRGPKLVLLCMLKDIGTYYKNGVIPRKNHCLAAASSYAFMHNCSPFGDYAKPILFYQSKYLNDTYDPDQQAGLLMSLTNQIVEYNYQEYTLDEMEELIKNDQRGIFNPDQIKKMFKLMREDKDIFEKLNDRNSLFIYETSKYISSADYSMEELLGFIDMATFAIEFHNNETLAHTVTVASIAEELGKLSKLPESMLAEIRLAALVHDIGKIRVPLEILCFPGKLDPKQYKEMAKHVEYTREIITGCFSYKIVDIASHHHEKLDGSGYPDGLRERDLSIGDKILAVADITSALYCKRSYKDSFNENKIKDILKSEVEKGRLDRRIVNHLLINWDDIMIIMKAVEKNVLDQYAAMKVEFSKLSKSKVLEQLFDYEDNYVSIFDDEEEKIEETEEEIIEEEIIEESLEDDQETEDEEVFEDEIEEDQEEIDSLEEENDEDEVDEEDIESDDEEDFEENDEELEETESEEEINEETEDDFLAYANSLEEKENKSEEDDFDSYIASLAEKENKDEKELIETEEIIDSLEENNKDDLLNEILEDSEENNEELDSEDETEELEEDSDDDSDDDEELEESKIEEEEIAEETEELESNEDANDLDEPEDESDFDDSDDEDEEDSNDEEDLEDDDSDDEDDDDFDDDEDDEDDEYDEDDVEDYFDDLEADSEEELDDEVYGDGWD